MKHLTFLLLALTFFSCNNNGRKPEENSVNGSKIDIPKELESIEETRALFQQAIKEKRYGDLSKYGTKDIISITPICGTWEEYKRLAGEPVGSFSYDSLIMKPMETIIVSDSIAYDFGTSSVYYTNEDGEPVEITDTFLAILKRDKNDGKWKLHREVATTNKME